MAKIIYALAGEGLGHATRSIVMIKELSKTHDIKIVCGGRAYEFLSKSFKEDKKLMKLKNNIVKIESLRFKLKNNEIQNIKTGIYNIFRAHKHIKSLKIINKLFDKFKPNLVITDFEPWTSRIAKSRKIPIISIDNEHLIRNTKVKNCNSWIKKLLSYVFVKLIVPKANYYFITSFFYPKIKKKYQKNTTFLPIIIRDEIKKLRPKYKKNLVLVYNSPQVNHKLIEILQSININKKFIVYDININKNVKNIQFKTHKEKEFFKDLADCEAVITTAGLSLISEAIYLKKPLYVHPVSHFEQIMNAHYLENLGYGINADKYNKESLEKWFSKLDKYKNMLKKLNNKKLDNDFGVGIKLINKKIEEVKI
ncbi:hypothetical protein HOC35_00205 [Candidatus Woesearchaeota archaeon]|jgi:uncharacterized protein (TIGR00661 family)|nr:hypothetical protein [Candidatus Woesearchaeota archaeon]